MQDAKGICQEWRSPTAVIESECEKRGGQWAFHTCLNLDAVANCTAPDGTSQVFYAEKHFTADQARAECAARPGFMFAPGNERKVVGAAP